MSKIKVKLTRSRIGTTPAQRKMLDSLGLKKINNERVFNDTDSIRGIIKKIPHLIEFWEISEEEEAPAEKASAEAGAAS